MSNSKEAITKVEMLNDALNAEGVIAANMQNQIIEEIKADKTGRLFVDFAAFYEPNKARYDDDDEAYKLYVSTFNHKMSKLRVRIGRACEILDMPKHTVKKVDGSWSFVPAKKKAVKEKDAFYQEVAKFAKVASDEDKATAIRLFHTLMGIEAEG
jgi:carboxylesterase type B